MESKDVKLGQPSGKNPQTKPTKETKRRFSWDDNNPAPPRRRPSRRPSREVSTSKRGDPPRVISNIFYGTIEFWLLVLGKQSWPFSFDPVSPKITISENDPGHDSIATSLTEIKPGSNCNETPPILETTDGPVELEPRGVKNEQRCWEDVRLRLGEKRDQLCLWKVGLSDKDLDGLLESESDIYRQLGKTVLDALLRLAASLSVAVDLDKTNEQTAADSDTSLLRGSAHKLDKLIKEASKLARSNAREYDPKLPAAFATAAQLLAKLQLDITRLSNLSLQIKLAINN
ncbi:uncharacterized protein F4822DRAFT_435220 [Hypoxylon trugodes]|uniref:uncharacterized protein n=1 Tax=Hypoxylon trugodes TaxID=326681 RepID=UPI0021956712|nr:uncharacterized protein F4822DRAFT_435220 [Hypoxylon trugodes]KAI1382845.1 hypothetical protein F4822DRAFT_435220 [Hypoxylon trugodes]